MKVLLLAVGLLVGAAVGLITDTAPCEEDEVLAVVEDTNPAHGLTWACVVLDDIEQRAAESGYNTALERLMRGERLGPTLNNVR